MNVSTTSVLPVLMPAHGAPPLADDLEQAGFAPLPTIGCDMLVRDALRQSPDLLVCWDATPADALLPALETLADAQPLPVLLFTSDASVESMQRALQAGVHGWVVNGYARDRLRTLSQLARERFARERALRTALQDASDRFEERKRIDRAKGLLMRASQISEDEAFRLLRTASMHNNRRVGQVSQQVIDAARGAESLNRAGQLRMLSQRVVKLAALLAAGEAAADTAGLLAASIERANGNLDALSRLLSRPTYGDLVDALRGEWSVLGSLLAAPAELVALDAQAERCLQQAERLVGVLQQGGARPTLEVVDLCGRQRMLSQRVAKQALLGQLPFDEAAAAFERALSSLRAMPLTTREIAASLDAVQGQWRALLAAARRARDADGRRVLASTSESLLHIFEQLTERYERSIDLLIGVR